MTKWLSSLLALVLSSVVFAKEISIGFSFAKPPYVFASQFEMLDIYGPKNDRMGIEIDLVKKVFEGTPYRVKPVFDTFYRVIHQLENGSIDAAETSGGQSPGLFYSTPIIGCENFAITKKSASIVLNKMEDLKGHWIVGWQGASTDLGAEFSQVVKNNPKYSENHDQKAQYKMFQASRADVIVIDKNIFEWWHHQLTPAGGDSDGFVYHALFPGVNEYRIGFRSQQIRDDFDVRLKKIRQNGEYNAIIRRYAPSRTKSVK